MHTSRGVSSHGQTGVPLERLAEDGGPGQEGINGAEHASFREVLGRTVATLDEAEIPYALIGGIAVTAWGRPRWTHDIDVFVHPSCAERALDVLEEAGYRTEHTDPTWLFKGFYRDVMVDVIFRCTGGFYLDDEMIRRSVRKRFQDVEVPLLPPEDLLLVKAAVHDERGPRHWHDALGIIARTQLDWDYLLRRARRSPRRLLSLLIYAHSIDLMVPHRVIRALFERVYGERGEDGE